jgi:hypothetical protein
VHDGPAPSAAPFDPYIAALPSSNGHRGNSPVHGREAAIAVECATVRVSVAETAVAQSNPRTTRAYNPRIEYNYAANSLRSIKIAQRMTE